MHGFGNSRHRCADYGQSAGERLDDRHGEAVAVAVLPYNAWEYQQMRALIATDDLLLRQRLQQSHVFAKLRVENHELECATLLTLTNDVAAEVEAAVPVDAACLDEHRYPFFLDKTRDSDQPERTVRRISRRREARHVDPVPNELHSRRPAIHE